MGPSDLRIVRTASGRELHVEALPDHLSYVNPPTPVPIHDPNPNINSLNLSIDHDHNDYLLQSHNTNATANKLIKDVQKRVALIY